MVWKEKNPPTHGPSTKWTKPSTPTCHIGGVPRTRRQLFRIPGPDAYSLKPACTIQIESRKRTAPAYQFGHQPTVQPNNTVFPVRTTEMTAPRPTCMGRQAVSSAPSAPSFSMSHRHNSMFDVKPHRRTPGPSDYGTLSNGLSQSPVLKRSAVIHFPKSERDQKDQLAYVPAPNNYDAMPGIRLTRASMPKHSMGKRIPHEPVSETARSQSYRKDSSIGEQRASLRRTLPAFSIGTGGRVPLPGLAGWSPRTPGPGHYG